MNIFEQYDKYTMDTYAHQPCCLVSGKGATCKDADGKEYIDFGSGIGVNSLGFADDEWTAAVAKQAAAIQHVSNYYYLEPVGQLAQALCEATGYSKVFFGNSGAEANEGAIKIVRKYSNEKYGADAGRHVIISLVNSFHGRTITALSATGQAVFHQHFDPFTPGFRYVSADDIDAFKAALDGKVCAVMIEPIQGEGGVLQLDKDYVQEVERICRENDILIIADEIQTGVGRTGTALCSEHYEIKPDVVTLAKGLGGGLPIGAILAADSVKDVLKRGDHGTTFGGNPVVCAGANVVVNRVLNERFLNRVADKGNYIRAQLSDAAEIDYISGIGMMLGLKLRTKSADNVRAECLKNGLIVLTAKDRVRLLPPLTISYDEINRGLEILKAALHQ